MDEPDSSPPISASPQPAPAVGGRVSRAGRMLYSRKVDIACVVLVFVVAAVFGMRYITAWGTYGFFYENRFGPSVMFALGKGLVQPKTASVPEIDRFLERKLTQLDPADLPADIPAGGLSRQQRSWLYLLYFVGWTWRIFGISWQALLPAYCLLFACCCTTAFLVFRLAAGPLLSLGCAGLFMLSPQNSFFLPYLRDYAKAPFILLALFLLGAIVKKRPRGAWLLAISVLYGVVVGVGVGFRKDIFICIPPALVVLACLGPGDKPWHHLRLKAAAMVLLYASFWVVSYPTQAYAGKEGSLTMHHILGGQEVDYNRSFGIGGVPYQIREQQNDFYIYSQAAAFSRYVEQNRDTVEYYELSYDEAAKHYLLRLFKIFPADFLLQAWAATRRIVEFGPFIIDGVVRDCLMNPFVVTLFNLRWTLFGWMAGLNLVSVGLALALLFFRSYRLGVAAAFLTCYFAGYSMIQFDLRHYFHLEVLFWLFPLFLLAETLRAMRRFASPARRAAFRKALAWKLIQPRAGLQRVGIAAVTGLALIFLPLGLARAIQRQQVADVITKYTEAKLDPLPTKITISGQWAILEPNTPLIPEGGAFGGERIQVEAGMIVLDLACERRMKILVNYTAASEGTTHTHEHTVELPWPGFTGNMGIFLPVYNNLGDREIRFKSLTLAAEDANRIRTVYRVRDLSQLPLMMTLDLPGDWRELRLCQRLLPELRPEPLRGEEARAANLLPDGGIEAWEGGSPLMFTAPAEGTGCQIGLETQDVAEGRAALRQTWAQPEAAELGLGARLHTAGIAVKPNTTYDLYIKAKNLSGATLQLTASQQNAKNGSASVVAWDAITVPPGMNVYREYAATITTQSAEAGDTLLLSTRLAAAKEFPATVLWDDWRLVERQGR